MRISKFILTATLTIVRNGFGQQAACPKTCVPPSGPKAPNTDATSGILGVITGILTCMQGVPAYSVAGYFGAGIMDMVKPGSQQSAWDVYQMEKYIQQSTDYTICSLTNLIGETFGKYMENARLEDFNNALAGDMDAYRSACHQRACLNLTNVPGNQRNFRGDGNPKTCCDSTGLDSGTCKHASAKDIARGNVSCHGGTGVCGTDHKCYKCYDFEQARADTRAILATYLNKDSFNFGKQLADYSGYDAMLAMAKSTTFFLSILSELVLLGDGKSDPLDMMISITQLSLRYIQPRMAKILDPKNIEQMVTNASTFTSIALDQHQEDTVVCSRLLGARKSRSLFPICVRKDNGCTVHMSCAQPELCMGDKPILQAKYACKAYPVSTPSDWAAGVAALNLHSTSTGTSTCASPLVNAVNTWNGHAAGFKGLLQPIIAQVTGELNGQFSGLKGIVDNLTGMQKASSSEITKLLGLYEKNHYYPRGTCQDKAAGSAGRRLIDDKFANISADEFKRLFADTLQRWEHDLKF